MVVIGGLVIRVTPPLVIGGLATVAVAFGVGYLAGGTGGSSAAPAPITTGLPPVPAAGPATTGAVSIAALRAPRAIPGLRPAPVTRTITPPPPVSPGGSTGSSSAGSSGGTSAAGGGSSVTPPPAAPEQTGGGGSSGGG